MTEVNAIEYGRRRIEYQVRRTSRLKTVSLAIDPVDGVLLSAPRGTSSERLARIVRAKAPWIIAKQKLVAETKSSAANKEFVSGETFFYLGRQYRLLVRRRSGPATVKLKGGRLDVSVPERAGPAEVRVAIIGWYRRHAAAYLSALAESYARQAGVVLRGVHVVEQRARWGSCDSGATLRFNWRIMQAPRALVDYVVAHEVTHLLSADHSATFWHALARLRPNADVERQRLAKDGSRYVW